MSDSTTSDDAVMSRDMLIGTLRWAINGDGFADAEQTEDCARAALHHLEKGIVAAGLGKGWPRVAGRCPACGHSSLFLGSGDYVTCAIRECPNPTAVADLLDGERP